MATALRAETGADINGRQPATAQSEGRSFRALADLALKSYPAEAFAMLGKCICPLGLMIKLCGRKVPAAAVIAALSA